MLDQAAPLVYAATQIAVALVLALPAVIFRSLRRPLKLAAVTALFVFFLIFMFVLAFDLTSPTGPPPLGTVLYVGLLGGVVWGYGLLHPRVHPPCATGTSARTAP